MLVHAPEFAAFLDTYKIQLDHAAQIFGVSRRTVSRWRSTERISGAAAQIVRSIEAQAAPWSLMFRRSFRDGVRTLHHAFRVALFGARWQDYRTPAERVQLARAERARQARMKAQRDTARVQRLRALRATLARRARGARRLLAGFVARPIAARDRPVFQLPVAAVQAIEPLQYLPHLQHHQAHQGAC